MNNVKHMLSDLIYHVSDIRYLVGSPGHGVLKYEIPACDLTIERRRVIVPQDEKIDRFGLKLRHGSIWREWHIVHPECLAYVRRLDSLGVQHGGIVREHYVDQGTYGDRVIPEHAEWVGDAQVLQDALTYLNMITE